MSIDRIVTRRGEVYDWATILVSQTLGTAFGDWMADSTGLGYIGAALVFGAGLVVVAVGGGLLPGRPVLGLHVIALRFARCLRRRFGRSPRLRLPQPVRWRRS